MNAMLLIVYEHQSLHQQLQIMPAGFMVYLRKACLGALPGSFLECACCGLAVLEVKCPYCMWDINFDVFISKKSSFCLLDGKFKLKKYHPFYYQCQLQLLATSHQYCDYVVWADDDLHIETMILLGVWCVTTMCCHVHYMYSCLNLHRFSTP